MYENSDENNNSTFIEVRENSLSFVIFNRNPTIEGKYDNITTSDYLNK